jgi:hypothetical protein
MQKFVFGWCCVCVFLPRWVGAQEAVADPFAFADFTWLPGNAGAVSNPPLKWKYFTGEVRVDTAYHYSLHKPQDHTLAGSSEVFRHGELQLTHLGIGGDFTYKNVMARVMTQFGMYSQTTARNDASPGRGQWDLAHAYRYLSEAYAGYHIPVLHGVNVQAGIFMSYIGLWSYYNFDNWTYQPSYVSSNTPWYFTGVRVQIHVTDKLKIEPWVVNGWQSYGQFNSMPGLGGQVLWRPTGWLGFASNHYVGADTPQLPNRKRFHTDNSVMVKYYENSHTWLSKAAASLTVDAGCEHGDGVTCSSQYFLGFMAYTRLWFAHNRYALTLGGGAITNPGRYLVLLPPVNGATALSGTPYFSAQPKDTFKAWDMQITTDYMPTPFVTVRAEFNHRSANVPYFTGRNGLTPEGGNKGAPGSAVSDWTPDLSKQENRFTLALMVKL